MIVEKRLEDLVINGTLKSYVLSNVSEDGVIGKESKFRNIQRLVLTFPNLETLTVETFCSGCAEDTCLVFPSY